VTDSDVPDQANKLPFLLVRSGFSLPEATARSRMMMLFLSIKGRVYMYSEGYIGNLR
jgi:hypothetical protein